MTLMTDDLGLAHQGPRLLAASDLHIGFPLNRALAERIEPASAADWLILAGDIGEKAADIEWALRTFSQRFAKVIWVPGNHELWTHGRDPLRLRGEARYQHLVGVCRSVGVVTPEDPYPIWAGPGGPAVVVPLFTLYDYSFQAVESDTKEQGLERAYDAGVVCTDERLLHPDPYASREAWCAARLALTERRLADLPAGLPTVLVNHYPLVREPTSVLRYPTFAQWCGTVRTADWPERYNAQVVVYGHLHIPRTTWYNGVRHEEVSLGYPREWGRRAKAPVVPRQILPPPPPASARGN
jgi:3',5'-cyclic AMP phosphodiesterase CpdA